MVRIPRFWLHDSAELQTTCLIGSKYSIISEGHLENHLMRYDEDSRASLLPSSSLLSMRTEKRMDPHASTSVPDRAFPAGYLRCHPCTAPFQLQTPLQPRRPLSHN